jgi:hypothetical protein
MGHKNETHVSLSVQFIARKRKLFQYLSLPIANIMEAHDCLGKDDLWAVGIRSRHCKHYD